MMLRYIKYDCVMSHKINQELDNGPGDVDEVYEYYLS